MVRTLLSVVALVRLFGSQPLPVNGAQAPSANRAPGQRRKRQLWARSTSTPRRRPISRACPASARRRRSGSSNTARRTVPSRRSKS